MVVHVGGVGAPLAAVFARKLGLGALQADAQPVPAKDPLSLTLPSQSGVPLQLPMVRLHSCSRMWGQDRCSGPYEL